MTDRAVPRPMSIPPGEARRPQPREPLVGHYRPLGIAAIAAAAMMTTQPKAAA